MSILLPIALATAVLYQNDFSTRTSAEGTGPGLAWQTFRYAKGQPAADNFIGHGVNYAIIGYNWKPCQDGWIKIPCVTAKNDFMMTHITDEEDPCLIFSGTNATIGADTTLAKDHQAYFSHTFRNVFKTGKVKMQVDIRQPEKRVGENNIICWFRPCLEYTSDPTRGDGSKCLIDVGMNAGSLSGGWRPTATTNNGERTFYTYGSGLAKWGHWYRHYLTIDLDNNKTDFEVYDLGETRIAPEATPTGSPVVTKTDCWFRYKNNFTDEKGVSYGSFNGFTICIQNLDTVLGYGAAGFDSGYSYMVDNIKGSYKANGSANYVDFYYNDFAVSRRRTVDGSVEPTSHNFTLDAPITITNTYTLYSDLVRPAGSLGTTTKPYLSGVWGTSNTVQDPGADGWRMAGDSSYQAPAFVTEINGNKMLSVTGFGKNMQPMCKEITTGKVRFEFDQRMPKGWNGTERSEINLLSQAAYDSSTTQNGHAMVRFGCCGTSGGTVAVPKKTARLFIVNAGTGLAIDCSMKNMTWYRFRADIDIDKKSVVFNVYELGDSAPINPDNVTLGASKQTRTYPLMTPSGYGNGIAAWGVSNWLRALDSDEGNDAAEFQSLIDNVRLWKLNDDGTLGDLVFANTFDKTTRIYEGARKSLWKGTKVLLDRPEYVEDGIIVVPTYTGHTYITGADQVMQIPDNTYTSISIPLGRTLRSGVMEAQYDVRLPNNVNYDQFYVDFGGAQLGSASMVGSEYPQRSNTGYAIRTGIYNDAQTGGNGVKSVARCVCWEGNGKGGDSKWYKTINSNGRTDGRWIRVKINANLDTKRYNVYFYNMGSTHPTLSTPDGTLITDSWSGNIRFRRETDPISYISIFGGKTPSYAPWAEDAPGALLLDNIKVCHDKAGLLVEIK